MADGSTVSETISLIIHFNWRQICIKPDFNQTGKEFLVSSECKVLCQSHGL